MVPLVLQKMNLNRPPRAPYTWLPHLLILMTSVTLIIGFIALRYLEARLIAAKGEHLALAAAGIADKLDLLLYERYADIQILSRLTVFQGNDTQAKDDILEMFRQLYPIYRCSWPDPRQYRSQQGRTGAQQPGMVSASTGPRRTACARRASLGRLGRRMGSRI